MFLHPYLLAGLAACAVPVALHLLMRQKPKRLVFPAFRFLLQKKNANQRRMKLQNLLLMLLRVAVLAFLVLALA
ncbi:MAG: BatA domain-containing protein, partial [Gemmataceae bacterium]|nr:BatA domain-containing protein [Gemmataceae bacterium]